MKVDCIQDNHKCSRLIVCLEVRASSSSVQPSVRLPPARYLSLQLRNQRHRAGHRSCDREAIVVAVQDEDDANCVRC